MLAPPNFLPSTAPKAPGMYDRTTPLEETLEKLPRIARAIGITRIADLTHLDRPRIPVMGAVVPDSEDIISVYNGKGLTREAALVGCVMEALERQTALHPKLRTISFVNGSRDDAIDARELGLREEWHDTSLDFAEGWDVIGDRPFLVPYEAIVYGSRCALEYGGSSNGLAAGNTWLEASYHALMELVERHIWSMATWRASVYPRKVVEGLMGAALLHGDQVMDDAVAYRISLPTGIAAIDELVGAIGRMAASLKVVIVPHVSLPYCAFATITASDGKPHGMQTGMGASWSATHAVIRAVTEAEQSRVCEIQGAREDLGCREDTESPEGQERSISPDRRWYLDQVIAECAIDDFADQSSDDLATDFNRLRLALRETGITVAAIVTIDSHPAIAVVRAVSPELESWAIDGRKGARLRALAEESMNVMNLFR